MTDELNVHLDGTYVGSLQQSASGTLSFSYDDDYRERNDATPLSLSMPLVRKTHKNRTVRAFLQGLLPDSAGRLEQLARRYRVSANNPFALLTHVGRDAAGAVQILPPSQSVPDAAPRLGDVTELDDSEFADLVADIIANRESWGRRDASARWSLPGAQPKVALFRTDGGRWAVPNDSTPTTHIIKPAIPPFSHHHLNEFMTMSAARHLGLHVAEDFLITTDHGDAAFVSVRYDRVNRGGYWRRLHQEDLCQAMAVPPDQKYQADGGPSVNRIAQLFAGLPDAADRQLNATRFFDALVFAVATQGTDAHAKNYSLMLHTDRATLAPLYDLGSHAPYPTPHGGSPALAMAIEGHYRVSAVGIDSLVKVGTKLGIDRNVARGRAVFITEGIVEAYRNAGADARAQLGAHPFIDELVDAITAYARGRGWHSAT